MGHCEFSIRTAHDGNGPSIAQRNLQPLISPIPFGPIWTDESILKLFVFSAAMSSITSPNVQAELRSQSIRIKEIPEVEASPVPSILSPVGRNPRSADKGKTKVEPYSVDKRRAH